MNPTYSVVIPAYNEERRIASTLRSYASAFQDSEVIVVLDGCTDGTAARVREIERAYPCVRLITIATQTGKGNAVIAGIASARAKVVAYTDADGATEPGELRRLCALVGEAVAVVGSRWLPGADVVVPQPFVRRAASRVFNRLVRALFGLDVSDTQCGAKAFRTDAVAAVLPEVETAHFAFDVDLLLALARRGWRIKEVPTRWRDVGGSKVRLISGAVNMFLAVLRLRLRHSRFSRSVAAFDAVFRTRSQRAPAPDGSV